MVYGLIRADNGKDQKPLKQVMKDFARKKRLPLPEWIEQPVPNNISQANRQLVSKIHKSDTLMVSKAIDLGLHSTILLDVLTSLLKKECTVYIIREDVTLPDQSLDSDALLAVFRTLKTLEKSIVAEQVSRSRKARKTAKAAGRLGRPKGSTNRFSKLHGKEDQIQAMLNDKMGLSRIGQKLKVSWLTVKAHIEKTGLKPNHST
jgi:DNA invertase Pin-like site-specific DNA recombinase